MTANALTPRVEALERSNEKTNEFINGNGQPGAKVRLSSLEANDKVLCEKLETKADTTLVQNISDQIAEMKKSNDRLYNAAITIAVGMIVYFVTQVIPALLKLIK
jgi:hypothetical protein